MRKVYIAAVLILSAAILLSNPLFREVTAAHDEDKEEHLFVWPETRRGPMPTFLR